MSHEQSSPVVVRPTMRLLADLEIELPPLTMDLAHVEHDALQKARGMAPSYPRNMIRIEAITDTLVYRYTVGRHRVATWLDTELNVLWVLTTDLRDAATYDRWIQLHTRHELLPSDDDYLRWQLEADLRLAAEIRDVAGTWLRDALEHPEVERAQKLGNGVEVFVFSRQTDLAELWVAIPQANVSPPAVGLRSEFRHLLIAAMEAATPGSIWEEGRHDYPPRRLRGYEIACLGLTAS